MPGYLAIAVYRSTVAGEPGGSLDLQVQYFDCQSPDAVRRELETPPVDEYANSGGERVKWPLAAVLAIDEFAPTESGGEVVGVITSPAELAQLVSPSPPPNRPL